MVLMRRQLLTVMHSGYPTKEGTCTLKASRVVPICRHSFDHRHHDRAQSRKPPNIEFSARPESTQVAAVIVAETHFYDRSPGVALQQFVGLLLSVISHAILYHHYRHLGGENSYGNATRLNANYDGDTRLF
jgi:hypothetical protein